MDQSPPLFHISNVVVGERMRGFSRSYRRALNAAPERLQVKVPRRRRRVEHGPEVVEQPRPRGLHSCFKLLGVLVRGLPVAAAAPLFLGARPSRRVGEVRVEAGQGPQRRAQVSALQ